MRERRCGYLKGALTAVVLWFFGGFFGGGVGTRGRRAGDGCYRASAAAGVPEHPPLPLPAATHLRERAAPRWAAGGVVAPRRRDRRGALARRPGCAVRGGARRGRRLPLALGGSLRPSGTLLSSPFLMSVTMEKRHSTVLGGRGHGAVGDYREEVVRARCRPPLRGGRLRFTGPAQPGSAPAHGPARQRDPCATGPAGSCFSYLVEHRRRQVCGSWTPLPVICKRRRHRSYKTTDL